MVLARRAAALAALIVVLPLAALVSPAAASCAAPQLLLAKDQRVLEVGQRLTVRGRYFVDGCNDTPSIGGGAQEPPPGSSDVPLRLRQDGRTYLLGYADAGGPDDSGYGRLRWDVTVPAGLLEGPARLTAPRASRLGVTVRSSPETTYAAVRQAIVTKDVAGFRELRVWRGAGSEVDVRGCSYGDQRPRRIVSCLHRAVEEKRLRLPEAPDRVLTLRQIVRSDHPTWSRERQRREVRQLTREVRRTTEQGVRAGDIASAQVDDAAKPGTPLDVLVVRVRDHWGLYWLETRTRVQE